MCTFGVGGNPLLTGRGGVCLLRCFLGGTGGHITKSGVLDSWLFVSAFAPTPTLTIKHSSDKISYIPLTALSVLPLSLRERCRCPLMFMVLTKPNISSTEECLRGELFIVLSFTGLEGIVCISHLTCPPESLSWTGNVALEKKAVVNTSSGMKKLRCLFKVGITLCKFAYRVCKISLCYTDTYIQYWNSE